MRQNAVLVAFCGVSPLVVSNVAAFAFRRIEKRLAHIVFVLGAIRAFDCRREHCAFGKISVKRTA